MNKLSLNKNPKVTLKFKGYPKTIVPKLKYLRELILETAAESAIHELE